MSTSSLSNEEIQQLRECLLNVGNESGGNRRGSGGYDGGNGGWESGYSREELEAGREELEERLRRWEMGNRVEDEDQEEVWQHDVGEHDGGYDEGKNGIDGSHAMAEAGPIKWVVLESSQLLSDPSLVANTMLTANEAVMVAGDYIDVGEGNERFCFEVTTSGPSHEGVVQEPEEREVADGGYGGHGDGNGGGDGGGERSERGDEE